MPRTTEFVALGEGPSPELLAGWDDLADRTGASPFLYPGFVIAWQRAFGESQLHVAICREGDRVVGVLPLVNRRGTLTSPANWHTPEASPLAEDDRALVDLVSVTLRRRPRRLALAFLDSAAPSTSALRRTLEAGGYRVAERSLNSAPFLVLVGDWEAFERAMPARHRKPIDRRARKLAELGEVSFEVADGSDRLDERFEEIVRIEALGWKGEQGTAIGSAPQTLMFYREVVRWGAERGWLRMQAVRLDGKAVAVAFGLQVHGVLHSLKTGFDPEFRAFGPGVLLMRWLVQRGFEDGLSRIELLGDAAAYKELWSSGAHERIALQAFASTPSGRADRLVYTRGLPLAKRVAAGPVGRLIPRGGKPRF